MNLIIAVILTIEMKNNCDEFDEYNEWDDCNEFEKSVLQIKR